MATSIPVRACCHAAIAAAFVVTLIATPSVVRGAGGGDDDRAPTSEYSLAKQALADGDYKIAIEKLTRLHEDNPDDADVLNLLGYGYRKMGNFDQARGYYLQALGMS